MDRQNQANDSPSHPWLWDKQNQQQQDQEQHEQQLLPQYLSQMQWQLPQEPFVESRSGQFEAFQIPAQHTGTIAGLSDALVLQNMMAQGQHQPSLPVSLSFGASALNSPHCTYPNHGAEVAAFLRQSHASRETPSNVDNQEYVFQSQPVQHQAAPPPLEHPAIFQTFQEFPLIFQTFQPGFSHQHNPHLSRAEIDGSQSAQMQLLLLQHSTIQQCAGRKQQANQPQLQSLFSMSLSNLQSSLSQQLLPTPLSQLPYDQQRPQILAYTPTSEECTRPAPLPPASASVPTAYSQFDREQSSPRSLPRNELIAGGPVFLAMPLDQVNLSPYQIFIRHHLELFASDRGDCVTSQQGRRRRVKVGQVGIRCRHCSHLPLSQRGRGSCYYPQKLICVYQAAQNIATTHLAESCSCLPANMRDDLFELHGRKDTAARWKSGGKSYWAEACLQLGLVDAEDGTIRFGK